MSESTRTRRVIALIAAYVVTLQALLLPLSVAAGPFKSSLCTAATSVNGSPSPAGHDSGCACARWPNSGACSQTANGPRGVIDFPRGPERIASSSLLWASFMCASSIMGRRGAGRLAGIGFSS